MWRNYVWGWLERYGAYVFGPLLIISSYLVNRYARPHFQSHFTDDLVVALLIAGILTLTVDPFIKRQARREATRDIFHHMLGFTLPNIIREKLQHTVEQTKLYRENMSQHIVMREEGEVVVFDVEMEFEVVNPTTHTLCFPPLLQFEKGEKAVLKSVFCFGESNNEPVKLSPAPGGLGAVEYRGKGVKITARGRRKFKYEFAVQYPTALGFWYPNFGSPTIGFSLTIKSPDNFRVIATKGEFEAPGEWRYPNRLWMPNEHFEIVWDKTG
jgi:hypothetical protein